MRKVLLSASIAAALLTVLLWPPVLAQVSNFTSIVLSGDLTVSDDATIADDVTVGGDVVTTPGTAIVVTSGSTITPLGSYVPITGSTGVGTSSIAGPTAGRLIYIVNMANATITFTDTSTLKLSSNFAMGQYDSITLRGDGTNWIEAGRSNN